MENTEQQSPFCCPNSLGRSTVEFTYDILLDQKFLCRCVQVRARRFREQEVLRDVVGAHPPRGPDRQ